MQIILVTSLFCFALFSLRSNAQNSSTADSCYQQFKGTTPNGKTFCYEDTNRNADCKQIRCVLFAEIIKSKQILYLYLQGSLVDSFEVSTGVKGRETPNFNSHPSGPAFIRYTSRKFPEGDYMGMGNMPYTIFISGGYAIHGTTPGNFNKLHTRASHGCIRLHPDNAKVFFELVKEIGLKKTWITIKE